MARSQVFCFAMESPDQGLDAGKHERSAIARPAEAQPVFGLHASFEAAWHAPFMGRPKAFDCAPPIRLAHAPRQQSMTSALAHALKEWLLSSALRKRPDLGAGWKPVQAGALSGKLTEPANTLYALEAEGQKGGKKEKPPSLPCHQASMAVRLQGRALLPESAK